MKNGGVKVHLMMRLASASLFWEQLWPRLWRVAAVVLVFAGVVLMDLLPLLPGWLHAVALIAFAIAFFWTAARASPGFRAIARQDARRRLEVDSGLEHRPLTALNDQLPAAAASRISQHLWRRHQERVADAMAPLNVKAPNPDVGKYDPLALRTIAVMVFVVGAATGFTDGGDRLIRALSPLPAVAGGENFGVTVWITPPAYTGLAPIQLTMGGDDEAATEAGAPGAPPAFLSVPADSVLLAQVQGMSRAPDLALGDDIRTFEPLAAETADGRCREGYRSETVLTKPGATILAVRAAGETLASWKLDVLPDQPPTAEFLAKPSKTGRAALKTNFEVLDDHGLANVDLIIRHLDGRAVPGGKPWIRLALPLPRPGVREAQGNGVNDLSAHPWAGTEVTGALEAFDTKGQKGESEPLRFLLPERVFNHPVARALVQQRKTLNTPNPKAVREVIDRLGEIMRRPRHFHDDTVSFLGISVARGRLAAEPSDRNVATVQSLLWQLALRIEDGDFAIAEQNLRDRQKALMEALANGAQPDELTALMEDVRNAMDQYLKALAQRLQEQNITELPLLDENLNPASTTDLRQLTQDAEDLLRAGAVDAARDLLRQLENAMEAIRNGLDMSPEQVARMEESRNLMRALQDLSQRQQRLLDETFQDAQRQRGGQPLTRENLPPPGGQNQQGQNQEGLTPQDLARLLEERAEQLRRQRENQQDQQGRGSRQSGSQSGGRQDQRQSWEQDQRGQRRQGQQGQGHRPGAAEAQDTLRRALGRMMLDMDRLFGGIPDSMGQADRSMRSATEQLQQNRPGNALPHQTEALENLRDAAQSAQRQMSRQLGGAMRLGRQGQGGQGRRRGGGDPFGRNDRNGSFGAANDGTTRVPTRRETIRAREILQELLRRSGERRRPELERQYIDRLLRQF